MKKILISILVIIILLISSCNKKGATIINNIYNNEITAEDEINISSLDDALSTASLTATSVSVGVKATKNGLVNNTSYGSGVIFKKENNKYYVLTCRHVITGDTNKLYDDFLIYINGAYFSSILEKYDEKVDLAILSFNTDLILPVVKISDNNQNILGRFVISVGSPYEMETYYNSVTIGNVSGVNRSLKEKDMNNNEIINYYLQHTATLNKGMSGGGLFNLNGELIGINDYKISNNAEHIEEMNFAVPLIDIINFISNI